MFLNIYAEAGNVIGQLLEQMPNAIPAIVDKLQRPGTLAEVFRTFDDNNDQKITLTELLTRRQEPTGALNTFLPYIEQQLQLGAGNEDTMLLPAVLFADLNRFTPGATPKALNFRVTDGISTSFSQTLPPSIQLGGYAQAAIGTPDRESIRAAEQDGKEAPDTDINDIYLFSSVSPVRNSQGQGGDRPPPSRRSLRQRDHRRSHWPAPTRAFRQLRI